MYVVFELDPALAIQNGFAFSVSEMNLCQATSVMQRECSNQYQIVTATVSGHRPSHKVIRADVTLQNT